MVMANADTAGITNNGSMFVRMPSAVATSEAITAGCSVTLAKAVLWRYYEQAMPSAYRGTEVTATCPAPRVLGAVATSSTEVQVTFSRPMDAATVDAGDFAITDGTTPLAVSVATASGTVATLTVAPQTPSTSYTVTVTGVSDVAGTAIDTGNNTATFAGFTAAAGRLILNEADYDMPGSGDAAEFVEVYNAGAAAADLTHIQLVLLNGGTTPTPRPPYLIVGLSTAVDSTGTPVTSLPAGGYLVVASANYFTGHTLPTAALRVTWPGTTDIFQNGGPDAAGLFDALNGVMLDSVSYEGNAGAFDLTKEDATTVNLPSQEGTGDTMNLEDVGNANDIMRWPNGVDTNSNMNDWISADFAPAPTPGAANQ
jgi:hypothetical protein